MGLNCSYGAKQILRDPVFYILCLLFMSFVSITEVCCREDGCNNVLFLQYLTAMRLLTAGCAVAFSTEDADSSAIHWGSCYGKKSI